MQEYKEKKGMYFLWFALFGLLVTIGVKPTTTFATAAEYFSDRGAGLASEGYSDSKEMPTIKREISKDGSVPVNQRITFGAVNATSNVPYTKANVLGNGSTINPGMYYPNVMSEITSGSYSYATKYPTTFNQRVSGVSIYRPSQGAASTAEIFLDPSNTKFYYKKLPSGEEQIKILSISKPTYNNNAEKERYVVEQTMTTTPDDNKIDITVDVTNATGSAVDMAIMFTKAPRTQGKVGNITLNQAGPIQSLGDNKGVSIKSNSKDIKYDIENTVLFPKPEDNGPVNWTIGAANGKDSFYSFNRGGSVRTVNGQGRELGYTAAESIQAVGDNSLEGTPYKQGYKLTPDNTADNTIQLKTGVKKVADGETMTLHWQEAFNEERMKQNESSVYREMDKQSGETLEDFDIVNRNVPVEINIDRVKDVSQVRNFMVFGGQATTDTLAHVTNPYPFKNSKSKINSDYRSEQVSMNFPRVITYNKAFDNIRPTSYAFNYKVDGDDKVYGGSGFGLATFQNQKVENTVPTDFTQSSQIDEYYLSKDGHSAKAYGMYTFGTGQKVPIKITLESANDKGTARMIFEYMNTLDHPTQFNSFYTVHMDLNGKHEVSRMKTLGAKNGVYFQDDKLDYLGANYYVAFYTRNSNNGVPVDNMGVYDIEKTQVTSPVEWRNVGGKEYIVPFNESQAKGQDIKERDADGNLMPNLPFHPGWYFTYAGQELKQKDIGRADVELKVTDLPDINYDAVEIIPEATKEAKTLADFTYEPIFKQLMFANMVDEGHKADNFRITTQYNPYAVVKESDFAVYANGSLIDPSDYTVTLDKTKNTAEVLFVDPVPWNLKGQNLEIKQKSTFNTSEKSNGIMKYYDKGTSSFVFDITAFNSWEVHEDPTEPIVIQDPATEAKQIIKYTPTIKADAVTGLTATSGEAAKAPMEYLENVSKPDFAFDEYVATFKNGVPPVFINNTSVTFTVVLTSKEFGNFIEVPVTVSVQDDVNMTVKHMLETPSNKTEKLVDINDVDLKEIPDKTEKVKISDDFSTILKKYQDEKIDGYVYKKTIVKVNGQVVTDLSKVPSEDFVVELYYSGQVLLDYPDTFDFGSHTISVLGKEGIRPKIIKGGNADEKEMKMQVVNTQGDGGVWKLSARQSKEMTNGTDTFKGKIYYVPKPNADAIELDSTPKAIESDSKTNQIVNRIPLLPKDLNTKTGIYIDINPGNKLGNYTNGEITWDLQDVL